MNTIQHACPHCPEVFSMMVLYTMHLERIHIRRPTIVTINLSKRPLTKEQKRDVVEKGEARLGAQHFIGEHIWK